MDKNSTTADHDHAYLRRAIELALQAEAEGNLPIGAVIVLDGQIVGAGYNHIWAPSFAATRHAEMEALRAVAPALWPRAAEMTLYTTLEPCLMCWEGPALPAACDELFARVRALITKRGETISPEEEP